MSILAAFLGRHMVTADEGNSPFPETDLACVDEELVAVIGLLGGKTFDSGLYRVCRADQLIPRTQMTAGMFDVVGNRAVVFAADWLGRQFAVRDDDGPGSPRTVVCLDAGGADSFATDQSIIEFHNRALVKQTNAALASSFFRKWHRSNPSDILPTQCVGYRVPLFLSGADELSNLELGDMGVYWHLCTEMWNRVKDLPEGTDLGEVKFVE
jgi:hypothetical protein